MKKLVIVLGISVLSLTACQKNEIDNSTANRKTITLTAAQTRTALGADSKTTAWVTGDRIGVWCNTRPKNTTTESNMTNGSPTIYQFAYSLDPASAGSANGVFTGGIVADDETLEYSYRVCYPYSASNDTKKSFAVVWTLPSLQSYDVTAATHDFGGADFVMGLSNWLTSSATNVNVNLHHAFALMNFHIVNSTGEAMTVKRVGITAPSGKTLSGTFTAKLHKNPITERSAAIVFSSSSNAVATAVSNGYVAADGAIDVKLIMNPDDLSDVTDGTTISVTTSAKTYTLTFTGIDFADQFTTQGRNSFTKTVTITPSTASAPIDNYDASSMALINSSSTYTNTEFGSGQHSGFNVYCIDGEVDFYAKSGKTTAPVSGNINIIGRNVNSDGSPKDVLKVTFACNNKTTSEVTFTFRNLILQPKGDSNTTASLIRFNSSASDVAAVTIEDCVIDYDSGSATWLTTSPLLIADAAKTVKNLTIRNTIFKNFPFSVIDMSAYTAGTNIESVTLENCTIWNKTETSIVAADSTPKPLINIPNGTVTIKNVTVYNYASTAAPLFGGAATYKVSDNVVATPTLTSYLCASAPSVASNNFLLNYSLVNGGTADTESLGVFTVDATSFSYAPTTTVKSAGAGDMRWNN